MLKENECYIIQVDGQYLIGKPYADSNLIRYSHSPWDGCRTRNFGLAIRVAKRLGGMVMKFNLLNGRTEGGWK